MMASKPDANDTIHPSIILLIDLLDILIDRAPIIAKITGMAIQTHTMASRKNPPRDMGLLASKMTPKSAKMAKTNIAPTTPPFIAGITISPTTNHSLPIYWP